MKREELKPLVFSISDLAYVDELAVRKNFDNPHDHAVYKATEVDAAIAELKEAWRSEHEACEALKAKLESVQASAYADSVDAGMRERRLRRALYKACANWAHEKDARYYLKYVCISDDARIGYERWRNVERKCRAKAEEY